MISGIDLASENVVLAVSSIENPYVAHPVRDVIGNDSIPCICCFNENGLYFGENASPLIISNPNNSIISIPYLLKNKVDEIDRNFISYDPFDISESLGFNIKNDNLIEKIRIETLTSMFIDYILKITNTEEFKHGNDIALSIPDNYTERELKILKDITLLLPDYNFSIVPHSHATAYTYGSRLFNSGEVINSQNIIFFDQGLHYTTISLYNFNENKCERLYSDAFLLGCNDYDKELLKYIIETYPQINKPEILNNKKKILRLFSCCEKIRKTLSTVTSAQTVIENVIDDDIPITITREKYESILQKQIDLLKEHLNLLKEKIANDNIEVECIEFVGGGSRIPFIKSLLEQDLNYRLSFTLDGLSVIARGAASLLANEKSNIECKFIMDNCFIPLPEKGNFTEDDLQKEKDIHKQLSERNISITKRSDMRNKLESYILNLRRDSEGKYTKELPPVYQIYF